MHVHVDIDTVHIACIYIYKYNTYLHIPACNEHKDHFCRIDNIRKCSTKLF